MIPDFCFGIGTDICDILVTLHSFFSCVMSENTKRLHNASFRLSLLNTLRVTAIYETSFTKVSN
jgi:hypothetical protein